MNDVTFFDVDMTLGNWDRGTGLFPGVVEFLKLQAEKRRLYTASNSNDGGNERISKARQFFEACLGINEIDSSKFHYIREDGMPRLRELDYFERRKVQIEEIQELEREKNILDDLLLTDEYWQVESEAANELRRKASELNTYLDVYVHKETLEQFDDSTRYQNPHNKPGFYKDLLLAKRIASPKAYKDLKTVMVGDDGDVLAAFSDPETPLIMINNTQRQGDWNPVSVMLDLLYRSKEKPFQMFDEMYNTSVVAKDLAESFELDSMVKIQSYKSFSSQGIDFVLAKSDKETRYVLLL